MHSTIVLKKLACLFVLLGAGSAALLGDEAIEHRRSGNPCTKPFTDTSYHLDNVRSMMSDTDSGWVEWRSDFGLQQWPADSVRHTTDSVVCVHIDSLIGVWMATSAAQAQGVSRWADWPGNLTIRINPHRYLVMPPLLDSLRSRWNFVVDSASGDVAFYRTSW